MRIHQHAERKKSAVKHALAPVCGWASSVLLLLAVGLPCSHFALASLLMFFSLKMEPEKLLAFAVHALYAVLSFCVLVGLTLCLAGIVQYKSPVMWFAVTLSVLFALPFPVAVYMGVEDAAMLYRMGVLAALALLMLVSTPVVFYFIESDILLR